MRLQMPLFKGESKQTNEQLKTINEYRKVDLHRHLLGSITVDDYVCISEKHNIKLPTNDSIKLQEILTINSPVSGLKEYFRPWPYLSRLLVSPEAVVDVVLAAIKEAAKDNVRYVEFRSSWGLTGKNKFSIRDYLAAVHTGFVEGYDRYNVIGRLVFGITRHIFGIHKKWMQNRILDNILEACDEYRELCVVGFDLSGVEIQYPAKEFVRIFKIIQEHGFDTTIHSGETSDAKDIWDALTLLHAKRIGHGLSAAQDGALLSELHDRQIPIEISLTSNLLLGRFEDTERHPIRNFLDVGLNVVVVTDNPGICMTTLTDEFALLINSGIIKKSDIERLTDNAISASFIDPKLIQELPGGNNGRAA